MVFVYNCIFNAGEFRPRFLWSKSRAPASLKLFHIYALNILKYFSSTIVSIKFFIYICVLKISASYEWIWEAIGWSICSITWVLNVMLQITHNGRDKATQFFKILYSAEVTMLFKHIASIYTYCLENLSFNEASLHFLRFENMQKSNMKYNCFFQLCISHYLHSDI